MKHKSLLEMAEVAQIAPVEQNKDAKSLRRQRLERFAKLLDEYQGRIHLFSMLEYAPARQRMEMRLDDSPLTVAYRDGEFRRQGLNSDRVGDAMAFFEISAREAHHLLCDCHYTGSKAPGVIAGRARSLAEKRTWGEIWQSVRRRLLD
jgi:hypothetical protein